MICYKCGSKIAESENPIYGLHEECYKQWFKIPNIINFKNVSPLESGSSFLVEDFGDKNRSFFHGKFKKYSAKLYDKEYILKVQTADYPELPKSEYLCNQIASLLNIGVPKYYLLKFEESDCFISYNFMQDYLGANLVHIYRFLEKDNYYIKDIINVIESKTCRYSEIVKFINLCLFDLLIGNNDRHGRNLGLIQTGRNDSVLAPCYDNPSYLSIEDEFLLGADFDPKGSIFTSISKEPSINEYVIEFISLGYKNEIKKFFKSINLDDITKLLENSYISEKRKKAFSNLVNKRYREFENAI